MILLMSLAVAVLFGTGSFLMLKRDLVRVIVGMILIGNAASLFIMASSLRTGGAPLLSAEPPFSDPLVQAMTLTAIVISFGVAALALSLVLRVYDAHHSLDIARISRAEAEQAELDDAELAETASFARDNQEDEALDRASVEASR